MVLIYYLYEDNTRIFLLNYSKNFIEEFPELVYNDGVKKLFLYVGGEFGGTEKLKSLLQYFSDSNTPNVTDTDPEHLHNIVENTKSNQNEYSRAVTPPVRQDGNRLSRLAETACASLLA